MNWQDVLQEIRRIHDRMRDRLLAATERHSIDELAAVASDGPGDTIFVVDRLTEAGLLELFAPLASRYPLSLVAEGMDRPVILPSGTEPRTIRLRVIVDPLDGSRGIMYDKRSAWILTGVAPERYGETTLADIHVAVQTEIPLRKQYLADQLWAIAGNGAAGERWNRLTGERTVYEPRPSTATHLAQGFGGLARFIPGARAELATIDDELYRRVLGQPRRGKAQAFEDQYIASGGQLAELVCGRDRWIADVRALLEPWLAVKGTPLGLCARPYDLCTELVAREAGVLVCDPAGGPLRAPLDTITDVSWVGYANATIRGLVEPVLQQVLRERGHLSDAAAATPPEGRSVPVTAP